MIGDKPTSADRNHQPFGHFLFRSKLAREAPSIPQGGSWHLGARKHEVFYKKVPIIGKYFQPFERIERIEPFEPNLTNLINLTNLLKKNLMLFLPLQPKKETS